MGSKSGGLRSILVVFQFAVSIVLIVGTIVVYKQLNYIQTKNLGFNKDEVLVVNGISSLNNNVDAFKNEVLQMPGVVSGTLTGFLPVSNAYRSDQYLFQRSSNDFDQMDLICKTGVLIMIT